MIFELTKVKDNFLEKIREESMKELDKFFKLNWIRNKPKVFLISDRETINTLREGNVADWVVGWTNGGNVYVLDRKNYENESSHKYSDEHYAALIKHELAHAFTLIVAGNKSKPKWLWEGVAIYLSGQNKFKRKPEKLKDFLAYYEQGGKGIYHESGFAVELLIKQSGEGKMLSLIKSLKNIKSEKEFKENFNKIYGFNPTYSEFNNLLRKYS